MKAINEKNADYLYCDETTFKSGDLNKMLTMHFKPDFAIDNLRANNYICHFSVFDRKLLDGTELFRSRFDGSQDHDTTRDGYYFTNGKAIHVNWKKTADYEPTKYYDDNGNEISLNTGKTMICIVEDGDSININGNSFS